MKLRLLSVEHISNQTRNVIRRFPGTAFIVFIATAVALYGVWRDKTWAENQELFKLLMTLLLGIPMTLSLHLVAEGMPTNRAWRWLPLVSIFPLTAFYFWLHNHNGFTDNYRYAQWFLYCHLFVAIAPFLKNASQKQLWGFNYRLFTGFIISRFFASALCVGIYAGLFAINTLLNIDFDGNIYRYVLILCFILISSIHFLTLIPNKEVMSSLEDFQPPNHLKIFCQYILVPLNAAYILILYAYMTKILVTGTWPTGSVSWLVSGVSVLGVFALLMMTPFISSKDNEWMKRFQWSYYFAIVPPPLTV